jgi:hypothetical protein
VSTDKASTCDVWDLVTRRHLAGYTFDASGLVCDIGGLSPMVVAGLEGLPRDIVFLQLRNSI